MLIVILISEVRMIVSSIQNFSTKNNYTFLNKNSTYTNKQLAQDTVSFCGNKKTQKNQEYNIIKQARKGNKEAVTTVEKAIELAKSKRNDIEILESSEDDTIKYLARIFKWNCFNGKVKHEFDIYNYPRIYRIIGSSEYEPLMKGKHITSELRNYSGVDVTNNMHYGSACTKGDKAYLITFKLKDNLDAFLSQLLGPHRQNGNSYVNLKNTETSEFILQGGYTLDDVENITEYSDDFPDGKMIYGKPTKKIKIELDNEKKQMKPEAEISDAKIEKSLINDGINDIGNIDSKPSKSDLDGATDGLSMQEFLEKENEALKKQDIDLGHVKIDDIDIPKIEIPDLDIDIKLDEISDEIEKFTKSSKTFKPILLLLGIGTAIAGTIYYISKKNKKYSKSLDKKN